MGRPLRPRAEVVLTELRVRDLAVIADVTLPLAHGLNVLTGETGAGKSMLVDALALLLGERASSDVVRPGTQKAVIEGAFELTSTALSRLLPSFTALGVELDDGRLVLKREISGEGRSRAWVNGSPTTVGVLAQLGALLVDLHGQHETQSLLRIDAQRDMLDAYADAAVERTAVRDAHERLRDLEQTLDTAGLSRAAKLVAGLARLDPSAAKWQELLDGAFAHLEELVQAVRGYAAAIESDPRRLGAVEQRRDVLFRLVQKYGPTLPDVLATRDRAKHELESLDTADLDLRNIAEQRERAGSEFSRACAALTAKRTRGAARLADAVNQLLPALGMQGGRFAPRLVPLPAPRSQGAEDVLFEVQLNLGLDARPLAKVASGGELSRLMLALKVVLAQHDAVPTLVFDEVDQGIGGEVGGRVGEALATVAQGAPGGRQVLVITHLPQIGAYADHHLVVAKGARGGIATSDVQVVTGDGRTRELARMLGDPDMRTALSHAAELLRKTSVSSAARSDTPSPRGPARRR
ncbi:MAG: hypothetical protein DMD42_05480 [Gemmatimonadetes bacterium]|nr:MAG: hypothetical protein DMD42_05480 [Gemmatimonadota bacterium]